MEVSAPWCLSTSRSTAVAPYLSLQRGTYHLLTEGRAYAKLPEGGREELTAGDIVIFPHGDAHLLGNGSPEKPMNSLQTFAKNNLARRIGLSRARFAERFRHFLGESPMAYLAQWRMKLGAEILQSTEDSVAEVAAAVGYGSEAAFNRAFKRDLIVLRRNSVSSVRHHRPSTLKRAACTADRICGDLAGA